MSRERGDGPDTRHRSHASRVTDGRTSWLRRTTPGSDSGVDPDALARRAAVPRAPAGHVGLVRPGELGAGPAGRDRERRRGGATTPSRPTRTGAGFEEAVRVARAPRRDVHRVSSAHRRRRAAPCGPPAEWVDANTAGPAARCSSRPPRRMTDAIERRARRAAPRGGAGRWAACSAQLGPLLQGTQIGQVLGILRPAVARAVRHRGAASGPAALLFVAANLARVRAGLVARPRRNSAPMSRSTRSRTGSSSRGRGHASASSRLLDDFLVDARRSTSGTSQSALRDAWTRPTPRALQQALGGGDDALVRRGPRRRATAQARPRSRRSWPRPRATATT